MNLARWRPRLLRWLAALLLLPLALGVTWTVAEMVFASGGVGRFWIPALAGLGIWLLLYQTLPRPMWIYVFGHELTHVVWCWMFGGRVKSFKVTRTGGEVRLTKSNTLVALAPYFFPIYTIAWSLVVLLLETFIRWPWWSYLHHLGVGVTYGFHLTLTAHILRVRQPDITGEGVILSGVLIWFGNALVLLLGLPWLTGAHHLGAVCWSAVKHSAEIVRAVFNIF
jgi:hypothetical protein